MFIVNWMFDKLGYMPKINMEVGKLDVEFKAAWPFPGEDKDFFGIEREKPKPRVKKTRALPSKATVATTTIRAKKAK